MNLLIMCTSRNVIGVSVTNFAFGEAEVTHQYLHDIILLQINISQLYSRTTVCHFKENESYTRAHKQKNCFVKLYIF